VKLEFLRGSYRSDESYYPEVGLSYVFSQVGPTCVMADPVFPLITGSADCLLSLKGKHTLTLKFFLYVVIKL
jgi:hypothetical protein